VADARTSTSGVSFKVIVSFFCMFQIDPSCFEYTMQKINGMFEEAERFDCMTFVESCLGCLTGGLYILCTDSKYEKVSECSGLR
jgi:hypothetical protein